MCSCPKCNSEFTPTGTYGGKYNSNTWTCTNPNCGYIEPEYGSYDYSVEDDWDEDDASEQEVLYIRKKLFEELEPYFTEEGKQRENKGNRLIV